MGIMVIYLGKARFVTLSLLLQNCFLITSLLIALSCHNKLQKQVARLIIMGFVLVTLEAQHGHGCSLCVAGRLLPQTPPLETRALQRGQCKLAISKPISPLTFRGPRALLEPTQMISSLWLKSSGPFFAHPKLTVCTLSQDSLVNNYQVPCKVLDLLVAHLISPSRPPAGWMSFLYSVMFCISCWLHSL